MTASGIAILPLGLKKQLRELTDYDKLCQQKVQQGEGGNGNLRDLYGHLKLKQM